MSGFEAQASIDTAASARCVDTAEGEYQIQFKNLVKNSYDVPNVLTPDQEALLKSLVDIPFVTSKTRPAVTHDHSVLYSCRALARQDYAKNFRIGELSSSTLVVGAAAREVSLYREHQNFDFYFHMSDAKDTERTIMPFIEGVLAATKKKIEQSPALRKAYSRSVQDKTSKPIFNLYSTFSELSAHYQNLTFDGDRFRHDVVADRTYNTLLFEDSLYNFGLDDIADIFRKTGATIAYGYMLLPEEFFFPEFLHNPLFSLKEEGAYTKMSYKGGYCNGYVHKTAAWRTLADNLGYHSVDMNLLFEIKSRVGPFVTFSIQRTASPLNEHRVVSLPQSKTYVKILNIVEAEALLAKGVKKFSYFPVLADEFYAAKNYFFTLKEASLNTESLGAFVRHRMTGAALVNKELLPPWMLTPDFFMAFVVALTVHVINERKTISGIVDLYTTSGWACTLALLRSHLFACFSLVFPVTASVLEVFLAPPTDHIVKYPVLSVQQDFSCASARSAELHVRVVDSSAEVNSKCLFCPSMKSKLGSQKVLCEYSDSKHTFSLDDDQIAWLKQQTLKDPEDTAVTKEEKEEISMCVPKTPFSYTCDVQLLVGAFGTGKTDYACTWADELETLCVGPFKFLMADYERFQSRFGTVKTFSYKTFQHKGIKVKTAYKVVLFDEYTMVGYEHAAAIVNNIKPNLVIFLGDPLQCVINQEHGTAISKYVDMEKISRHTLLVNYRNAQDVVALANLHMGYRLEAASSVRRSIEWADVDDIDDLYPSAKKMFFSNNARDKYSMDAKCIPSHQGMTYSKTPGDPVTVVLYVTKYDAGAIKAMRMVRVGMTRHKCKLVVATDSSLVAAAFKKKYTITDEQIQAALPVVKVGAAVAEAVGKLDLSFVHNSAVRAALEATCGRVSLVKYHEDKLPCDCPQHSSPSDGDWVVCAAGHGMHPGECHLCSEYAALPAEDDAAAYAEPPRAEPPADPVAEILRGCREALELRYRSAVKATGLQPLFDLFETAVAEVRKAENEALVAFMLKALRKSFELYLLYRSTSLLRSLGLWRFLVKVLSAFSWRSLWRLACASGYLPPSVFGFSTTTSGCPGLSLKFYVVHLLASALRASDNPVVHFIIAVGNITSVPTEYVYTQVKAIITHYIPYSIGPFHPDAIQSLAASSARMRGYTEFDTGPKNGYCWTVAFSESWSAALQVLFPPGIGAGCLSLLYTAAILVDRHRTDVDYFVSHMARSPVHKEKFTLLRSFMTLQPCYTKRHFLYTPQKALLLSELTAVQLRPGTSYKRLFSPRPKPVSLFRAASEGRDHAARHAFLPDLPLVKAPSARCTYLGLPLTFGTNPDGSSLKCFVCYSGDGYHFDVRDSLLTVTSSVPFPGSTMRDSLYVFQSDVFGLDALLRGGFDAFCFLLRLALSRLVSGVSPSVFLLRARSFPRYFARFASGYFPF